MKNTKGFVGLLLAVIIATIVLAGGAYLVTRPASPSQTFQDQPDTTVNTQTNTSTNSISNQTSSWKTYTNAQYGFEIQYPSDWTAKRSWADLGGFYYIAFGPAGTLDSKPLATLEIYPNRTTLDNFVKGLSYLSGTWVNITLGGTPAKEIVSVGQGSVPFVLIAAVKGSFGYQLKSMAFGDNVETVKKMSSTFKFTNKTSTSTTQDIKINGITITIPANWKSRAPNIDDACMRSAHCSQSAMADGSGSYKLYNPQVTTADKVSDPDAIYITGGKCDSICPVYPNPIDYPNRSTVYLQGLTISTYSHNAEAVSVYNSIVIQLQ